MAEDVGIIDFAIAEGSEQPVVDNSGTETEQPVVDNSGTETEQPVVEEEKDSEKVVDNSVKSEEKITTRKGEEPVEDKNTPKTLSEALKFLKTDPKHASAAKIFREDHFGREAYAKTFPTVQSAREAKAFIDAVGGAEGWESTQGIIQNIKQSDELLHAGDPKIWDNIVDDLKTENHLDALPKLASGGLDTLKKNNADQYYEVIAPHFLAGLETVRLPNAVASLGKYLGIAKEELAKAEYKGDTKGIQALEQITKDMDEWIKGLQSEEKNRKEAATKVDPERLKLEADRKAFTEQQTKAEQTKATEFKQGVAKELDSHSNVSLGKELTSYLSMPFFKGMPQKGADGGHAPWKIDLGNGIKQALYSALEADKSYQIAMKAQWGAKVPDKAKIQEIHKTFLANNGADIVKQVIESRYPGYAKGGSAAGRVAAAAVKKDKETKITDTSVSTGKPVYVAVKPQNLVRDTIRVAGKEYSPSDLTMLEVTGKGFVKTTDNKVRFVTWRK
jgi:hypothetical protein